MAAVANGLFQIGEGEMEKKGNAILMNKFPVEVLKLKMSISETDALTFFSSLHG